MQIWHYSPSDGTIVAVGEADPDPMEPGSWLVPAFATVYPPPHAPQGSAPVWRDWGWAVVEDHRGEMWWSQDGEPVILDKVGPPPEGYSRAAPAVPTTTTRPVTPRQIRLALTQIGLRSAVEQYVQGQDISVRDSWEYSTQFERNHPLILGAAAALGRSEQEIDVLFALAATL